MSDIADRLNRAALTVSAYDWSDNDDDAVRDLERLVRIAVEAAGDIRTVHTEALGDGWRAIAEAPKGVEVFVYTPPQPGDWPDQVRIDVDYISEDHDDWHVHAESYEHFLAVGGSAAAGPDSVCIGPSPKAPYTHWMRIRAIPAPQPPKAEQ